MMKQTRLNWENKRKHPIKGRAEGEAEDWKSQWTSTSWAGFKFRHHVQRDSNAAEEGGQQKPQACIHGEAPVTFKTSRFLC